MPFQWGPCGFPKVHLGLSNCVPSGIPVVPLSPSEDAPSTLPAVSLFLSVPSCHSNGAPLTLSAVPHQSSGAPSTYPMTLAPPNVTLRLMVALRPSLRYLSNHSSGAPPTCPKPLALVMVPIRPFRRPFGHSSGGLFTLPMAFLHPLQYPPALSLIPLRHTSEARRHIHPRRG